MAIDVYTRGQKIGFTASFTDAAGNATVPSGATLRVVYHISEVETTSEYAMTVGLSSATYEWSSRNADPGQIDWYIYPSGTTDAVAQGSFLLKANRANLQTVSVADGIIAYPVDRFRGDDWEISISVTDADGNAVPLGSYTMAAELYLAGSTTAIPITGAVGSLDSTQAQYGVITVFVDRDTTSTATASSEDILNISEDNLPEFTRIRLYGDDTDNIRTTFAIQPVKVVQP